RLHEWSATEKYQSNAIPFSLREKVIEYFLHRGEPIDLLSFRVGKILCGHRAGKIDSEQHIANGNLFRNGRLNDLWPRKGDNRADPSESQRERAQPSAAHDHRTFSRCLTGLHCEPIDEWDDQAFTSFLVWGCYPVNGEWQWK